MLEVYGSRVLTNDGGEPSLRSPRWFQRARAGTTGSMTLTGCGISPSSVVKDAFVDEEIRGWRLVKPHMEVLPTRATSLGGQKSLVVKYCESRTLSDLLDDDEGYEVFSDFFHDLTAMWDSSRVEYRQDALRRDYRSICLEGIGRIERAAAAKLQIGVEQEVRSSSGIYIGTIGLLSRIQREGFCAQPGTMVLSHGDENFGNVLHPTYGERSYVVIDARFAGYYDEAWVLANILARTYLFNASYPGSVQLSKTGECCVVSDFEPHQSDTTCAIKDIVIERIRQRCAMEPDLSKRVAAYFANNVGRSIANMRDKSFDSVCNVYGKQHYLTAMLEARKLSDLAI